MHRSRYSKFHSILLGLILLSLSSCFAFDYITGEGEAKRIRKVGKRASAQILEIWDTRISVNDDPVVGFKLRVHPENADSYVAETTGLISSLHVPQIQPGAIVQVAIDPEDSSKVALDVYED